MNNKNVNMDAIKSEIEIDCLRGDYRHAIQLAHSYRIPGVMITQSTVRREYGLSKKEIAELEFVEIMHYDYTGSMKLYLVKQVQEVANRKVVGRATPLFPT